jgi:hypothetical protein
MLSASVTWTNLLIPVIGLGVTILLMALFFIRFRLPRLQKSATAHPEKLIALDSDYRRQLWSQVNSRINLLLKEVRFRDVIVGHQGNLRKIDRFIAKDLQDYYKKNS